MNDQLYNLQSELETELDRILTWWSQNTPDQINGGFIGKIGFDKIADNSAVKGAVMNARILWTYASAARHISPKYTTLATRAFDYFSKHFYDRNGGGGIFWSVNADGTPADTKNQIYALSFAIYGLSEYHALTGNTEALEIAVALYKKIRQYSRDSRQGGYFEAFTRDWKPIADVRLSEKDANEQKTANTHLHIVEAYANLYRVWPDDQVGQDILELLLLFDEKFINKSIGSIRLFFNELWQESPDMISYGHDIEAAWLLLNCAETTKNSEMIGCFMSNAMLLADGASNGIDTDGAIWYEYSPQTGELIKEKHWWPQAEMMIGYFNAWEISGQTEYLQRVFNNWNFIRKHIIDLSDGEWNWGIDSNFSLIEKDMAGFWKGPYHNGRMCIELISRIKNIRDENNL